MKDYELKERINREIDTLDINRTMRDLLKQISNLDDENLGCYAKNEYLAKATRLKSDTVSRYIGKLIELGYLRKTGFDGRVRTLRSVFATHYLQKLNKSYLLGEVEYQQAVNSKGIKIYTPDPEKTPKQSIENPSRVGDKSYAAPEDKASLSTLNCTQKVLQYNSTKKLGNKINKNEMKTETAWNEFMVWAKRNLTESTYKAYADLRTEIKNQKLLIMGNLSESRKLMVMKFYEEMNSFSGYIFQESKESLISV